MKSKLLLLLFFSVATILSAQQKVAILETVDKAGNVNYGIKLLLRSSLTSAISNTEGYEGYDRVDMASIAGEQEFQRTGAVSDNQIKEIGRAAGASYVLVAEAAKYDATSLIITAKLLDVETFGVKSSAVQVSGIGAAEMQESCTLLAAKLLKPVPRPAPKPAAPEPVQPAPQETEKKESKPANKKQKKEKERTEKEDPEKEQKKAKDYYAPTVEVRPVTEDVDGNGVITINPQVQVEPARKRRNLWMGFAVEGGVYDYYDPYAWWHSETQSYSGMHVSGSFLGLTIDLALPLGNWFGIGPYIGASLTGGEPFVRIGGMTKISFNNNAAILLGGGYADMEKSSIELRIGLKFSGSLYLTGIYMPDVDGFAGGLGFSFGGKLK